MLHLTSAIAIFRLSTSMATISKSQKTDRKGERFDCKRGGLTGRFTLNGVQFGITKGQRINIFGKLVLLHFS